MFEIDLSEQQDTLVPEWPEHVCKTLEEALVHIDGAWIIREGTKDRIFLPPIDDASARLRAIEQLQQMFRK